MTLSKPIHPRCRAMAAALIGALSALSRGQMPGPELIWAHQPALGLSYPWPTVDGGFVVLARA